MTTILKENSRTKLKIKSTHKRGENSEIHYVKYQINKIQQPKVSSAEWRRKEWMTQKSKSP